VEGHGRRVERITWIKEDGALLLRDSRCVLCYRKTCYSSGTIVVIHWDLEKSALEVGVRGVNFKARTIAPSNLQEIQEDY